MTYNFKALTIAALLSHENCLEWLQSEGLVLKVLLCPVCKAEMHAYTRGKSKWLYRCHRERHNIVINAMENTFFGHSRYNLVNMVTLIYYFSQNIMSYDFLTLECCDGGTITSSATISEWLSNCREACLIWLYNECDRDVVLGGPGVLVEVDLCRVGKCKYNAEVLAEGTWLLGMMELNNNNDTQRRERYRLEVCADERQDPESVITLVAKHSLPGTRIVTNLWGEYFGLPNNKYHHYTVNDSQSFVEPMSENSCHLLESSWQAKKHPSRSKSDNMAPYLAEYLYRREVKLSGEDSFAHFLRVIRAPFPHA